MKVSPKLRGIVYILVSLVFLGNFIYLKWFSYDGSIVTIAVHLCLIALFFFYRGFLITTSKSNPSIVQPLTLTPQNIQPTEKYSTSLASSISVPLFIAIAVLVSFALGPGNLGSGEFIIIFAGFFCLSVTVVAYLIKNQNKPGPNQNVHVGETVIFILFFILTLSSISYTHADIYFGKVTEDYAEKSTRARAYLDTLKIGSDLNEVSTQYGQIKGTPLELRGPHVYEQKLFEGCKGDIKISRVWIDVFYYLDGILVIKKSSNPSTIQYSDSLFSANPDGSFTACDTIVSDTDMENLYVGEWSLMKKVPVKN